MIDLAEFSSEEFSPFLPDAAQVNPQVYGAELAWWLCRALAEAEVVTGYPEYEDWGWYIEYFTAEGGEFALHCGNIGGSSTRWLISLRPFGRRLFGRDKPPVSDAAPLIAGIRRCLEDHASITDLNWMYEEPGA